MYRTFNTSTAGTTLKEKQTYWHDSIKAVIFDLDIEFDDSSCFDGLTEFCDLGSVQLTRVKSSAVSYRRHARHCDGMNSQILVCLPLVGEVELDQLGRKTKCKPGEFVLEHGDAPYRFEYGGDNDMWVLQIPEAIVRARARNPDRFCSMRFAADAGVGRLFSDYLKAVARNVDHSPAVRALVGAQLTDLLAAVLEGDSRVLQSSGSSVRNAHLARIEHYIRSHLNSPELSPDAVAGVCGMSVRYLHLLFKGTDQTFAQWVREHRLQLAYETLSQHGPRLSIAQVAYQHGFNDHAHFSSAFKKKFGRSPSEVVNDPAARP